MKIVRIGRRPGNDVVINDPMVSGNHCQLICDDNGVVKLIDMNSTNGTFVNGQVRYGEVVLNQKDIVMIGNTMLPWQSYVGVTPQATSEPTTAKPESILVWAILCTIFCSILFGILAIVFNNKFENSWNAGRHNEALDHHKKAKTFCWIGLGIAILRILWVWRFFYLL